MKTITCVNGIFYLLGFLSVTETVCPEDWDTFDGEDACIKSFETLSNWSDARSMCIQNGADLLQVWSQKKEIAIMQLRSDENVSHWVGISDFNNDSTLEYLNKFKIAPITWPMAIIVTGDLNDSCLAMGRSLGMYIRQDCHSLLFSICEMKSGVGGICWPDWFLYEQEDVCLTCFHGVRNWEDSRKQCQDQGGELVKIWNKEKEKFVRDLKNFAGVMYWVGVIDYDKDGILEYLDGTKLIITEIEQPEWSIADVITGNEDLTCVMLAKGGYQRAACSSVKAFICEMKMPRCHDKWELYPEEGVCVKYFDSKMDWKQAHKFCQETGSTLADIWSKNKSDFLIDNNLNYKLPHWIGIGDVDDDKVTKHVNGSYLVREEDDLHTAHALPPPVPQWYIPSLSVSDTQLRCVVLGAHRLGFNRADCQAQHRFLCEIVQYKIKPSPCPESWYYYAPDNTCLEIFQKKKTWQDARRSCHQEGGDLVDARKVEKHQFLNARAGDVSYWVGASSLDNKGTALAIKTIFDAQVESRDCPAKRFGEMVPFPCMNMLPYVCESVPDVAKISDEELMTCRPEFCICKDEYWTYFPKHEKFIKINNVAKNFSTSAWICENLGGRLLTILDNETEQFVKSMVSHYRDLGSNPFWIGLRSIANNTREWMDGTLLDGIGFEKLNYSDVGKECATVTWDPDIFWVWTSCDTDNYHICEAIEPCSSFPGLFYNGEKKSDGAEIVVTNEHYASIECLSHGYPHHVTSVKLSCGNNDHIFASGKHSVSLTLSIDIHYHDIYCVCRLLRYDLHDKTQETRFRFNILTSPNLANKEDNDLTVTQPLGEYVRLKIDILANPIPQDVTLYTNGSEVRWEDFKISINPRRSSLYSSVYIVMEKFDRNVSHHTLVMNNGIGEPLVFTFHIQGHVQILHDHHHAAKGVTSSDGLTVVVLTMLGVCLLAVFMVTFKGPRMERRVIQDERLYPLECDHPMDGIELDDEVDDSFYSTSTTNMDKEYIQKFLHYNFLL